MMQKWEYKTVTLKPTKNTTISLWFGFMGIDPKEIEQSANELGQDGWELVTSTFQSWLGHTKHVTLIFKRLIL